MSHADHLHILANEFQGDVAPGRVPHTMLYGFLDAVIVGRCSVRHTLNAGLSEIGGHIGYGVAPPFRRQGFATQLFRAGREHLKSLGVDRAFMTCDSANIGSSTLIENAGGVLQDEVLDAVDDDVTILRFWVDL